MILMCPVCGKEFGREEYNNIYGTYCICCGGYIPPIDKPIFIKEREKRIEEMKKEFIEKLKDRGVEQ